MGYLTYFTNPITTNQAKPSQTVGESKQKRK